MAVKVCINELEFLLTWPEFEKALSRVSIGNPIEILDIVGGSYV